MIQLTYDNAGGTHRHRQHRPALRRRDSCCPNNGTLTYGLSLNNNPTVQDLWNSTPAWGFPYDVEQRQRVAARRHRDQRRLRPERRGTDRLLFWNESLYVEVGGYRSAQQGVTNQLTGGAGPLDGTASQRRSQGLRPTGASPTSTTGSRNTLEVGRLRMELQGAPGRHTGAPSR